MIADRIYSSSGPQPRLGTIGEHVAKRQDVEGSTIEGIQSMIIQPPTPRPSSASSTSTNNFLTPIGPATTRTPTPDGSIISQATSAVASSDNLISGPRGSETTHSSATESLASSTESSEGASTPQPSDGNKPTAPSQDNGSGSSGLGGGAIAGIAIAAVLVIALIGGWFFWRRRKRMRGKLRSTEISAHIAGDGSGGDGGIPELDTKERPQEMPGSRQVQTQELDPTQYTKYAMNGSHELKTESEPAELLNGPDEYTAPVPYHAPQRPAAEMTEITDTTKATNNSLSSNVEAQRRREMEWLEMEEKRMRKRRELLAAQGGAKN